MHGSGCNGGRVNMEAPQNGHTAHELPGICQLLPLVHKRIRRQNLPYAATEGQQKEKLRLERKGSGNLRENKAGTVRSASARHAHRERHVLSRH